MTQTSVSGLKVLVVEDETLVLMDAEMMLEDLGCEIVATAMRMGDAMEKVDSGPEFDVAILDVNLAGEMVLPLAEKLRARHKPMLFASGYGQSEAMAAWRAYPMVQKPYGPEELERALVAALEMDAVVTPPVDGSGPEQ